MKQDIQIPDLPGQWLDKFCAKHPKIRLYKCQSRICTACNVRGFCNQGIRCGRCDIDYLTERKMWTIKDRIAENERLRGGK
jgi:hypothetical protein